jgi:hypothetical protein
MNAASKMQNRMFRTIVMMGSSLAVGCGGIAQLDGPSVGAGGSGDSTSSGGRGGSDGAGVSGNNSVSAGGTISRAGAGAPNYAGAPAIGGAPNYGGAPGAGGEISITLGGASGSLGLPSACPPSQWSCDNNDGYQCDGYIGSVTPTQCQCDLTRPKSAAECNPDTTYTCLSGDNIAYSAFECACTSNTLDCGARCSGAVHLSNTSFVTCELDANGQDEILCGCAIVVLK